MYRIQSNLFNGYDLFREDRNGLTHLSTWTSFEQARQAKEREERKARQEQFTLNLATFGCK